MLAALTCLFAYASGWYDEVFAATSVAILVFVVGVTACLPRLVDSSDEVG